MRTHIGPKEEGPCATHLLGKSSKPVKERGFREDSLLDARLHRDNRTEEPCAAESCHRRGSIGNRLQLLRMIHKNRKDKSATEIEKHGRCAHVTLWSGPFTSEHSLEGSLRFCMEWP